MRIQIPPFRNRAMQPLRRPAAGGHAQFSKIGSGGTDGVTYSYCNGLNIPGDFTLCARFKLEGASTITTFTEFFGVFADYDAVYSRQIGFAPTAVSGVVTIRGILTDTALTDYTVESTINDQDVHLAAVTYNGTDFKLYIDGVEEDSIVVPDVLLNYYYTYATINQLGAVHAFSWGLDDVQIYSVALTALELTDLYNRVSITPQPVFNFPLDEDANSTGPDYVGTRALSTTSFVTGPPGITAQALRVQASSSTENQFQCLNGVAIDKAPNTISLRVKVDSYGTEGYVLPAYITSAAFDGAASSLQLELGTGGYVNIQIATGGGGWQSVTGNGAMTIGQWASIIFVSRAASFDLYVNGVVMGTESGSVSYATPNSPEASYFTINPVFVAADFVCDFTMGPVVIYDTDLSPADIVTIASGGTISTPAAFTLLLDGTTTASAPFLEGDSEPGVSFEPPAL